MRQLSSLRNQTISPELTAVIRWLEKRICYVDPKQHVVGERVARSGLLVSQTMFDNKERDAHVCPFVQDSIDADTFWLDESALTDEDESQITSLLLAQIPAFKQAAPAHEPQKGVVVSPSAVVKTFMTVFPYVKEPTGGTPHLFEVIHDKVKSTFRADGLMLGQFFHSCRVPGTYNPNWTTGLRSPWPAFAVRYMHQEDRRFIDKAHPDRLHYDRFF